MARSDRSDAPAAARSCSSGLGVWRQLWNAPRARIERRTEARYLKLDNQKDTSWTKTSPDAGKRCVMAAARGMVRRMLFLFLGFLSAWIVPRIGCVGAVGSILLLYGLITMVGTPGVFVWFAVLLALRHAVRPA